MVAKKVASPDLGLDATVGVNLSREVDAAEGGTAGGTVGTIGGDGDSVALWLAIAALAITPIAYPASRSLRFVWERWRGKSGGREKGVELCVKYSRRD